MSRFELPAIVKHFKGNVYCAITISKKVDIIPEDIKPTLVCKYSEDNIVHPIPVYKLSDGSYVHLELYCNDDELVIYRAIDGHITYVREKEMFFDIHPEHNVYRFESMTTLNK